MDTDYEDHWPLASYASSASCATKNNAPKWRLRQVVAGPVLPPGG